MEAVLADDKFLRISFSSNSAMVDGKSSRDSSMDGIPSPLEESLLLILAVAPTPFPTSSLDEDVSRNRFFPPSLEWEAAIVPIDALELLDVHS